MKKKMLVLALIFSLLLVICFLTFLPEKNLCGPRSVEGRSPEFCDRSCDVDSDCVDRCGCGLINKNENCELGTAEIECLKINPLHIKCIDHKCAMQRFIE